jgi:RND family efflux transporter MFP subunit
VREIFVGWGIMVHAVTTQVKAVASKKWVLPLVILAVAFLIGFYLLATKKQLVPIAPQERVWAVDVVPASYADVQPELTLYGQIAASRSSELRAQVAGRIIDVSQNFRDGGIVEKGDLLVSVDPFDYETALAEQRSILKEAEIAVRQSRRKYDRAVELHAENNVSDEFLDDAELNLRQQEARFEQQQIAVKRAERDMRETLVVAPFSGVVSNLEVELGQQISGSDRLADLIDLSRLEVQFSLSNAQFGRLLNPDEGLEGRQLRVSWQVGKESLEFNGRVSRAGAEITSSMGGVMVYAGIENTDRFTQIRPGALVTVTLADKLYQNVLRVPSSALYSDNTVYIVRDNRLEREPVEVVGFSAGDTFLQPALPGAIANGDLIVTTQLREAGIGARAEVR